MCFQVCDDVPFSSSSSSSSAQSFRDQRHLSQCHYHTMEDGTLKRCLPAWQVQCGILHMCWPSYWHSSRSEGKTVQLGWETKKKKSSQLLNSPPHLYKNTGKRKLLLDSISVISAMTAGCPWASAVKIASDWMVWCTAKGALWNKIKLRCTQSPTANCGKTLIKQEFTLCSAFKQGSAPAASFRRAAVLFVAFIQSVFCMLIQLLLKPSQMSIYSLNTV